MNTILSQVQPLVSGLQWVRSKGQSASLVLVVITMVGGFLSKGVAHPSTHHLRTAMASKGHPVVQHERSSFQPDIKSSHQWLNVTDHPEGGNYTPIPASQGADMYPDVQSTLVMNPYRQGKVVFHRSGSKGTSDNSTIAAESIAGARSNWAEYLAEYRTIADQLGADGAFYPTEPPLVTEARVEMGSEYERSPGSPAYSPNWPGKVYLRDGTTGRDVHYTPFVKQTAQIPCFSGDKMAQEFLSPFYYESPLRGLQPFELDRMIKHDEQFVTASAAGNRAAAEYKRLSTSSAISSHDRGRYARLAAHIYHEAFYKTLREVQ